MGTMRQRRCCCFDDRGFNGGESNDASRCDVGVGVTVFCCSCRRPEQGNGRLGTKRESFRSTGRRLVRGRHNRSGQWQARADQMSRVLRCSGDAEQASAQYSLRQPKLQFRPARQRKSLRRCDQRELERGDPQCSRDVVRQGRRRRLSGRGEKSGV